MVRARFAVIGGALTLLAVAIGAQRGNNPIASLKGVAVPPRPDLARYVADPQSLLVLGKALFWDTQRDDHRRQYAEFDHRDVKRSLGSASHVCRLRRRATGSCE